MISSAIETLEHEMGRASKRLAQGLLSALSGFLLAVLLLIVGSSSDVNIPWTGVKVPAPLGSLIFLLASTALGGAAAFYIWREINSSSILVDSVSHANEPEEEKEKYLSRYRTVHRKSSPLITNIYVLGAATLSAYMLHTLTIWSLLTYMCRFSSSCPRWYPLLAIGLGVFVTAFPYGLGFVFKLAHRRLL